MVPTNRRLRTYLPRPIAVLTCCSAGLLLLTASPVLASSDPAGHGDGHATAGTAHVERAHGGDHGAAHGPPQAEKIHNWFSFKDRDKYPPIGWAIVNFVILLILLVKFAGKPFRQYLRNRHDGVRKQLDEAAALRARAQAQLLEIETRVRNLDQEIARIKQAVAEDAELEKELIIGAARKEADRIVAATERAMAEDLKRVHRELEGEAVEAAMAAAEKLLKQQVNEGDHQRLNSEYLTALTLGGGN